MNNPNNEPQRVLRFWRDLEIFNIPNPPTTKDNTPQTKVTTLRRSDVLSTLPWHLPEWAATEHHTAVHVVYIGVADIEDLARLTLRALLPDESLSEREIQRLKGLGWLAAFVVNEQGIPKPDSYLPASFAHGVDAFRKTGTLDNINARLQSAQEEFAQRCHRAASAPPPRRTTPMHPRCLRACRWTGTRSMPSARSCAR
ncbi:hypothetical protein [Dyella sp. M7H15-1]|uniref:hypothetical protein n=1 Tax=Dyella sp. M7H15-1 TaxID=2501295 RepID=UPI001F0B7F92|nr:hypothetical protein [Dyella sp. M7H15-1]